MQNLLLFVLNAHAGVDKGYDLQGLVKEFCQEHQLNYEIFLITDKSDVQKIPAVIKKSKPKYVIGAGGDGTVNMLGRIIMNYEGVSLGILPTGSGNGLAKDLKIPLDIKETLKLFINPHIKYIDVIWINDKPCFHLADLGFNAKIVKRFDESHVRGLKSYIWSMAQEIFKLEAIRYTIQTSKEHIKENAYMITIANSNQYGSNLVINPKGKVDDGLFEICIIKPFSILESLSIAYLLLRKKIHRSPRTKVIQCKEAIIYIKKKEILQIDGELQGKVKKLEIRITPHALGIIVPKLPVS